jgi:hypothetical protein
MGAAEPELAGNGADAMADLSWARELGTQRRTLLEREAKATPDGAQHLVDAMFDGLINHLWYQLATDLRETAEAYNAGGAFTDLSFSSTHDSLTVQRRHHPTFAITLEVNHASRRIQVTVRDGDAPATTEPLPVVFVDDTLLLWHGGQTENGYQLAKRLLRPRLQGQ